MRFFSTVLGAGVMLLTYAVGRLFFGTAAALIATALVGVSPLLFQDGSMLAPKRSRQRSPSSR